MKTIFAILLSLTLIVALSSGVSLRIHGLISISVVSIWVLCFLALFVTVMLVVAAFIYNKAEGDKRVSLGNILSESAKPKGVLMATVGWVTFVALASLLAWSGWVFTAVVYVVTSITMRLAICIAREEAVKQGLA